MNTIPYVYFVKNKTTQLKYIGVKYAKNCNPLTFWKDYFTSSSMIKKLIELYGKDDFEYKILKTFESYYQALQFEANLLKYAIKRKDYVNIGKNFLFKTELEFLKHEEKMYKIRSFYGKLQAILKTGFHGCSMDRRIEIASKGGVSAEKINKELNRAIFNEDFRKKQHETLRKNKSSAFYDPALRHEISSKGGKNGFFSKSYYENNNISIEELSKKQSERGKLGGKKNKGTFWINDGIKSFKFTQSMSEKITFDEFLLSNPNIQRGKIKTKNNEN